MTTHRQHNKAYLFQKERFDEGLKTAASYYPPRRMLAAID